MDVQLPILLLARNPFFGSYGIQNNEIYLSHKSRQINIIALILKANPKVHSYDDTSTWDSCDSLDTRANENELPMGIIQASTRFNIIL